jgi:inosose dehydratase
MVAGLEQVADVARAFDLRPAVHPHAGGYIEFEDELERVVSDTEFDLCLDTGHLAYAGVDPAAALETYGERLAHVHLKDVDRAALGRVHSLGLAFWAAIEDGVFCPLGQGVVDFAAVSKALEALAYEGFATIEQDRAPGTGSPLDDLTASVEVIRAVAAEAVSE